MRRIFVFALLLAAPAFAGNEWIMLQDRLSGASPTFTRPIADSSGCSLDTAAGPVTPYSALELTIPYYDYTYVEITAETCAAADFDTVVFLYQRDDGGPGAFNPALPCENLSYYDDNSCGEQSRISGENVLAEGRHVTIVVFPAKGAPVGLGRFSLLLWSHYVHLNEVLFLSGFETGDAESWSAIQP